MRTAAPKPPETTPHDSLQWTHARFVALVLQVAERSVPTLKTPLTQKRYAALGSQHQRLSFGFVVDPSHVRTAHL